MLTIEEIKAAVTPICERYGVEKMWLFGSYARGEADEKSDVDLIHVGGKFRGFEYGGFYADIRDALGVEIDLLSKNYTRPKFLNAISKDEVLLYERGELKC